VRFGLFAGPRYLEARGLPERHADLAAHDVMALLKQLAIDGAGIAILPVHLCVAETRDGTLVHLLPAWWGADIAPAYLVYPSRRDISPRVRAFAQCLKDVVTSMATMRA